MPTIRRLASFTKRLPLSTITQQSRLLEKQNRRVRSCYGGCRFMMRGDDANRRAIGEDAKLHARTQRHNKSAVTIEAASHA